MSQESLPFDSESWNAQSASVAAASDNDLAVALVELAETIAEEIDDSQPEQGATTSELREELTAKVLSTLRADAERSEGTISREDLERQCFRRSLTVGECLYVESELLAAGVVVGEATPDDLAPIHSASPSTERRTSQNSGRFLDEVQERELGRKIQLFLRAKNSHEISPQEQLNRLMSESIDAKAAFVETNIRWLRQTSSRFARTKHLTEEDLFQEGVFGLIRATELWDPERSVKGGVKGDQCGGAKGSHLGPEMDVGIAGARASGA